MMGSDTLFLRLEGPMQAWGAQESKFSIRRSTGFPTKSGVIGLLCAAMGLSRSDAQKYLSELADLSMGVRVDRPGMRWWDYHTVGAEMDMRIAEGEGKTKSGAMLTRREYLCDASFLVALQGPSNFVQKLAAALESPVWTLYLGRKSCPPTRPILEAVETAAGTANDLAAALAARPWRPRLEGDPTPETLECRLEWRPSHEQPKAPAIAELWYDVPLSFEPPAHRPRFVVQQHLALGPNGTVAIAEKPGQCKTPAPPRPRADYRNTEYRAVRKARLDLDNHLCTVCKLPATTVQHVTYRHAGGGERIDELRSLCRLCHDAVTMIEYGLGMGMDRIDPVDPRWRNQIVQKREEIIAFRSLETRRRKLSTAEEE